MKKKFSKKQGIILLIIALVLTSLLYFSLQNITKIVVTEDFMKFLIGLSISLAGLGVIAFQLDKLDLKKDFLNFSIIMTISTISGISYLANKSEFLGFSFGEISSFLFIWGIILFLAILIEERVKQLK